MTAFVDDDDAALRARLRDELDTTFVVEAAAGTGKTTVLVSRILSLITHGRARLSNVVSVTFTEKAAGEMKLRIREKVETARQTALTPVERQRLEAALSELEAARIGTIHSLCGDLLRERPVDAGVDPMFAVASEEEARGMLDAAFDGWFARVVADPSEGIRRFLRRAPRRSGPSGRKQLRDAAWRLIEHRDFEATWRRDPTLRREEGIDAVVEELSRFAALVRQTQLSDYPRKLLGDVCRFVEDLAHREAVAARDHDGLEALLRDLSFHKLWSLEVYGKKHAPFLAERDRVKDVLQRFVARCDADLAACLRQELRPLADRYEAEKAAAGKLDFTDLLLKTRALLRDQPAARQELQRRFTHLFVDEFQDTDPLQADILLLLAAAAPEANDPETLRTIPGKLFVVGDPKQSIYAFRRADVALYQRIKQRLCAQGAELVYLSKSFRAVAEIQEAVNTAFAPAMGEGSMTQARYVPLQPGRSDAPPARPAVIALPVPHVYSPRGQIVNWRIDGSLPDAVGAFVEWLIHKSGWTVTEADQPAPVPLQARHVCILFRRFQSFFEDVTRPYATALEARRVPHVLVGGRSFHAREEVLALRNALTAIEWPDDELAVFATLRGPLFALQDDALVAFRGRFGRMRPLRPMELEGVSASVREVADALAVLGKLHRGRNRRPIADTIALLLEETRAHAGLAFWTAGEQALANALQLAERARRFEAGGATSFRSFVEQLHDEADEGEGEEAKVVEEGTDGVRLMTVHRAKGLEFPVVILADLTARATPARPSRHVDTTRGLWAEPLAGCVPLELLENGEEALRRDRDEGIRLAYVAATRARDVLVIPAVGDQEHDGWLSVLNPVIYPRPGTTRQPAEAPDCPRVGRDTVLDRPEDRFLESAIGPGLHLPKAGTHRVVWWDPATLSLGRQPDVDERRERVLHPSEGDDGAAAYRAWEAARAERLAQGARPSVVVQSIREAAEAAPAANPRTFPVEQISEQGAPRPGGRRFGALMHAILGRIPLDATDEQVAKLTEVQARLLGATPEERAAAERAVHRALVHPLYARARAAETVLRELPLIHRREDGTVLEGVADLAFRERGQWTVVELKTDAPEDGAAAAHHAQLALYVEALALASGDPADGVLGLI